MFARGLAPTGFSVGAEMKRGVGVRARAGTDSLRLGCPPGLLDGLDLVIDDQLVARLVERELAVVCYFSPLRPGHPILDPASSLRTLSEKPLRT